MLAFLKAKAERCRDLARRHDGNAASRLRDTAADLDEDIARWQRRLIEAAASTRRQRAARLPWRVRGEPRDTRKH